MRLVLLVAALSLAAPAAAQVGTLAPVDEAASDPSFVLFRARLLEAVATRDTALVLAHLHPDVKLSFGGAGGVEDFRAMWLRPDAAEGELWSTLAAFVPFGSTYATNPGATDEEADVRAAVPYWFEAWPAGFDVFEHLLVVGENVNVRAGPSADAPVLTQLSHAIVRAESYTSDAWAPILLASGDVGYVAERFIRSPVGYRMGFGRVGGRWRIAYFVAGD